MKPYYQFWLEGEKLAEDDDLNNLIKFVSEQLSSGNWQPLNCNDFQFIKCEPISVNVEINFKIEENI